MNKDDEGHNIIEAVAQNLRDTMTEALHSTLDTVGTVHVQPQAQTTPLAQLTPEEPLPDPAHASALSAPTKRIE